MVLDRPVVDFDEIALEDNPFCNFFNLYSDDWSLILQNNLMLFAVISCNFLTRLLCLLFKMFSLMIYEAVGGTRSILWCRLMSSKLL